MTLNLINYLLEKNDLCVSCMKNSRLLSKVLSIWVGCTYQYFENLWIMQLIVAQICLVEAEIKIVIVTVRYFVVYCFHIIAFHTNQP